MTMSSVGADLVLLAQMLGSMLVALKRVVLRPSTFRFTSMVHQLERVGWRAVPIILLITVSDQAPSSRSRAFSISASSERTSMSLTWLACWCCAKSAC